MALLTDLGVSRGFFLVWQQIRGKTENVAKWVFHDLVPLPLTMRHALALIFTYRPYGALWPCGVSSSDISPLRGWLKGDALAIRHSSFALRPFELSSLKT